MLENIRIVLMETSHSGNIGSAARAMKTMGLSKLYLVAPKQGIDEQAIALAAGAEDIVHQAKVVAHFEQAVADCQLVMGTSARLRHLPSCLIEPRECGQKAMQYAGAHQVAIVFGRERIGLTNEELLQCRYHVTIPANPDYSSLNLAMAVQLICYELRMAYLDTQERMPESLSLIGETYPEFSEIEHFFQHMENVYTSLGFIQNQGVMPKLRRLYQRVGLEKNELNMLRGMLSAVEKHIGSGKGNS